MDCIVFVRDFLSRFIDEVMKAQELHLRFFSTNALMSAFVAFLQGLCPRHMDDRSFASSNARSRFFTPQSGLTVTGLSKETVAIVILLDSNITQFPSKVQLFSELDRTGDIGVVPAHDGLPVP